MRQDRMEYEFTLDDQFFTELEVSDIHKGNVEACLTVRKALGAYLLDFHIEGVVTVTCDRCLDDLALPVSVDNSLKVKLGTEYSEEEDLITIPEEDGFINVAWLVYEFVALSLPMKKVHLPGECNETMMKALNEHACVSSLEIGFDARTEEDSAEGFSGVGRETDPRWDELKKILDNN
ncbi:MAG TPA: DUF177 domain-containing protein [Candidatus Phocaeicola excrementigallinarum]|nr:DUF177 domain-containing protein [Candidatus Phocaeicola excrementigallinarum]